MDGFPHSPKLNTPVFMDCEVPHVTHQTPRNGWKLLGNLVRHVSGCFAYDNEVADDSIRCLGIQLESLKVHAFGVVLYPLDGFEYVCDPDHLLVGFGINHPPGAGLAAEYTCAVFYFAD